MLMGWNNFIAVIYNFTAVVINNLTVVIDNFNVVLKIFTHSPSERGFSESPRVQQPEFVVKVRAGHRGVVRVDGEVGVVPGETLQSCSAICN